MRPRISPLPGVSALAASGLLQSSAAPPAGISPVTQPPPQRRKLDQRTFFQMARNLLDWHPSPGWVDTGRRPPRRFKRGSHFGPVRAVLGVLLLMGLLFGGVQSAASAPDGQDEQS